MPPHLWDMYMLTVHELSWYSAGKTWSFPHQYYQGYARSSIKRPTPAVIHSPDGLNLSATCMYMESHTLAHAQCMVKADSRVVNAFKCKVARESKWKRKNNKHGSSRWHEKYMYNQVAAEIQSEMGWPKFKQMVKDLVTTDRVVLAKLHQTTCPTVQSSETYWDRKCWPNLEIHNSCSSKGCPEFCSLCFNWHPANLYLS